MLLRNVVLGFVSAAVFFSVVGYSQSASIDNRKIRICNNEQCLKTSELIDIKKYEDQNILVAPDVEEAKKEEGAHVIDYLTLVITGVIPTFGFIWWLLNSQQDRKIIEFSQSQDIKFKLLMKEVIDKQEENTKSFSSELKELIKKIDNITQTFSDNRLEYFEKLSHLNEKLSTLTLELKMLQTYMDKIDNIEGFLNKQFDDYHIRK